jgi:putative inorganic carbon (hco3(-)) transporter
MRDYVLTVIVFAMVPVCIMRPWIGILMWYWLGLMNPHRLTWGFAYTMPFAMAVGGATLIGAALARDRRPIPWERELVLMAVLLAYFCFTTLFAWAPTLAWIQLEKVAKIIIMTLVATMFIYGKERIRYLLLVTALSIGYYGFKGGLWVLVTGGGEEVIGPEGTFIEGNTFISLALNMVIPLLVALALEEKSMWLRRFLYLTAGLSVIASFFTYSRGGWLGLAIVVPLLLFKVKLSHRILLIISIIVLALGARAILPDRVFTRADTLENYEEDCSANQRLMAWTVNWNLAQAYPITGAGFQFDEIGDPRWLSFGDPKYAECFAGYANASAHSIYFQILGQHGFVAFFIYLFLLIGTQFRLARLRREAKKKPGMEWIAHYAGGIQVGLFGYFVSGAFLSSAYFDLAWLYYAVTAILARELAKASLPAAVSEVRGMTGTLGSPAAGRST